MGRTDISEPVSIKYSVFEFLSNMKRRLGCSASTSHAASCEVVVSFPQVTCKAICTCAPTRRTHYGRKRSDRHGTSIDCCYSR